MRHAYCNVDLLRQQICQPVFHQQGHLHQGVNAGELRDQRHEVALAQGARASDPQRSAYFLLGLARNLGHIAQGAVNLLRLRKDDFADFSQHQLASSALDEPGTEVSLQPCQLARYHRLAEAQSQRCRTDAAFTDDGGKRTKKLGVDARHLLIVALNSNTVMLYWGFSKQSMIFTVPTTRANALSE